MELRIRTTLTQVLEEREREGRAAEPPLRKVVVGAVLHNPFAGRYVDDLSDAVDSSGPLGTLLGGMAVDALGDPVLSYGKGGIAGLEGAQEHAVMFVTTIFGNAFRDAVGGGAAWIPSASMVAAPGAPLTIPLAHKDALFVRDHYDAATLHPPSDAPRGDEVLVAVAVANRGRIGARLGGPRADAILGEDGLR